MLAIIPIGIYRESDGSFVGALSFNTKIVNNYAAELWGVGSNNSVHCAQIMLIYT